MPLPPANPIKPEEPPVTGGLRETASRLHAFNRYEIKYLIDEYAVPELRAALAARMESDPFSPAGGYPVNSVYYDTPDLRFYWEKIEGLRFRRKLRMRLYGNPGDCSDNTTVHVEIKQRVNRVTQKRRIALPYGQACAWLNDREPLDCAPAQKSFVDEVTALVGNLDLRPIVTTGYTREALIGCDADLGLRATIDHRVHGRDSDLGFGSTAPNRYTIPPKLAIVELKANERIPYWITDLTARMDMSVVRVSKYCQSIEAFGLAPRSVVGVAMPMLPDTETALRPSLNGTHS